jgi:hypothetical protein
MARLRLLSLNCINSYICGLAREFLVRQNRAMSLYYVNLVAMHSLATCIY